jgi:hypothetical protein
LPNQPICNEKINIDLTPYGTPTGGVFSGPGVLADQFFNPSVAGDGLFTLYYALDNAEGCTSIDSIQVQVETCTNLPSSSTLPISLYPNPTTDQVWLQLPNLSDRPIEVSVIDAIGSLQYQNTMSAIAGQAIELDFNTLAPGIYYVLVQTTDKKISEIKKVVKL